MSENEEQPVEENAEAPAEEVLEQAVESAIDQEVIQAIPINLTIEVGSTTLKLKDLLKLSQGSLLELDRTAGELMDIKVNNTVIAKGEVVMIGERFGIRFTEVVDPKERVQNL